MDTNRSIAGCWDHNAMRLQRFHCSVCCRTWFRPAIDFRLRFYRGYTCYGTCFRCVEEVSWRKKNGTAADNGTDGKAQLDL